MGFTQIQQAVDRAVMANGGRAFISDATAARSAAVRTALEQLAIACGVQEPREEGLSNSQLAMLYAVARKDMARAQGIAKSFNEEQAPPKERNPLLDGEALPKPRTGEQEAKGGELEQLHREGIEALLEMARKEASIIAGRTANDRLTTALDGIEETLARIAQDAVAKVQPKSLIVKLPDSQPKALGVVHEQTERLIKMLAAGVNVYLHGPAGSGKTTAAQKAAEAFGRDFYFTGKVDSEYALLGFTMPNGNVVKTPFRIAYEFGGLFLFDEIDRSDNSAIVALNAALANGVCSFPDGTVKRHANFMCIAGGNTTMRGADNQYLSGQQQDASSVNRFAFLYWPYDEKLELAITSNKEWCAFVQRVRKAVAERGIDCLVTPRASLDGSLLLAQGFDWPDVAEMVIWKGLDADTVAQLLAVVGEA